MPLKACPKCATKAGPRTKRCSKCLFIFIKKESNKPVEKLKPKRRKRKKKEPIPPWNEFSPGDTIKIGYSGGPYFETESGRISMGYVGQFQVHRICDDGILAIQINGSIVCGFCFIYMGKEKKGISGTIMRPHKIVACKRLNTKTPV